jgi:hypothetical protein
MIGETTVLGEIIGEEVGSSLAAPEISRLVSACTSGIEISKAATAIKVLSMKAVAKTATFVILSTATIVTSVVFTIGNPGEIPVVSPPPAVVEPQPAEPATEPAVAPLPNPLTEGIINFVDGECKCGHLNPKGASLDIAETDGGNLVWQVTKVGSDTILASGEGNTVTGIFSELISEKADGDYTLTYVYTDVHGQTATMDRDFHIDTSGRTDIFYE